VVCFRSGGWLIILIVPRSRITDSVHLGFLKAWKGLVSSSVPEDQKPLKCSWRCWSRNSYLRIAGAVKILTVPQHWFQDYFWAGFFMQCSGSGIRIRYGNNSGSPGSHFCDFNRVLDLNYRT
jgi:hypothetical protein